MLESAFQAKLKKKLKEMFPNCVVIKNDPENNQGFPDLTIFYNSHYALLECKRSEKASHQPNQDYYISLFDKMSFARFIYPENEKEVLYDLTNFFYDIKEEKNEQIHIYHSSRACG